VRISHCWNREEKCRWEEEPLGGSVVGRGVVERRNLGVGGDEGTHVPHTLIYWIGSADMPIVAVEWNAGTMWGSHNSLSGKSETWGELG